MSEQPPPAVESFCLPSVGTVAVRTSKPTLDQRSLGMRTHLPDDVENAALALSEPVGCSGFHAIDEEAGNENLLAHARVPNNRCVVR